MAQLTDETGQEAFALLVQYAASQGVGKGQGMTLIGGDVSINGLNYGSWKIVIDRLPDEAGRA